MNTPSLIDRQILAACFLRNRVLFEEFLACEKPAEIWDQEKALKLWCDGLERFYEVAGRHPSTSAFKSMINTLYQGSDWADDYDDDHGRQLALLKASMEMAVSFEKEKKPESEIEHMGRKVLRQFMYYLLRAKITQNAAAAENLGNLINDAQKEITQIDAMDGSRFRDAFPSNDLPSRPMTFSPTGITFVDSFCNGGMLSGEVVGHAAPIGSGKTTLDLQIMWARTQMLMVPYMQPGRRVPLEEVPFDKMPRIYGFFFEHVELLLANFMSNAADIPRSTMEQYALTRDRSSLSTSMGENYKAYELELFGRDVEVAKREGKPLPFGEYERFQWAAAVANKLIRFVDFSGGDETVSHWAMTGVDGMSGYIRAHQHTLNNPGVDLALLDYVGAMVTIACSSGHYNVRDRINVVKGIPMHINQQITGPFRCPAWASHQLNSDQNDRDGGTIPNPNKTDGCHMFLENCAQGFASGKLTDDGNVAVFVAGKNRRSEKPKPMLARLDKTYARWIGANDSHQLVDGKVLSKLEAARQARSQVPFLPSASGMKRDVK